MRVALLSDSVSTAYADPGVAEPDRALARANDSPRKSALTRVLALLLLPFVFVACGLPSDVVREEYPSVEAARQAGLFSRGWLPDVLPPESGTIIALHDVDTSERCTSAVISDGLAPHVLEQLRTEGFARYSGGAPAFFRSSCPAPDRLERGTLLRQELTTTPGLSLFAGVDSAGVLYVWSGRIE